MEILYKATQADRLPEPSSKLSAGINANIRAL